MNLKINSPSSKEPIIPLLRRDIKIYRGPDEIDGSPTYNCLDPIRAQYFKISWAELVIINHLKPEMTLTQLVDEINKNSNLKVTAEEIKNFFEDAARNHLLDIHLPSEEFLKESSQKRMHPIIWALYHYLYIRVPILNPDHFLARTLPYVRVLVSTPAILIYLILITVGLVSLVERFDEFLNTFPYFFNLQGLIFYAIGITVVKVIHEFSHAYVAKFYRLHIPTMGVAFIVLWPVLYTDVTDGWKLHKRSQRLAISFAGVAAEVILAGLSTLGWTLSEPGLWQSIFFIVASVTWLSTLLVNLNPAMRFDGYYLMSDLIGIDNLQFRAFAFTRWQLRKWFLGLNVPPPEEGFSFRRRLFMMGYSIYTWIYRITLYTVIAIFVYYEFTKALGIILFMVEVGFFIAPPFFSEGRQLWRLSSLLTWNVRSVLTTITLILFTCWFIVPLPHRERFSAVVIPRQEQTVYVPHEGKIETMNFKLKDYVEPKQTLVVLSYDPLNITLKQTQADIDTIKAQLHILSLKDEDRAFIPEKMAELATLESKLKEIEEEKKLLTIQSTISGVVYEWDDTLHPQEYVSKNQIVAKIAPLHNLEVMCFVPESKIQDIQKNGEVIFRLKNSLAEYKGKVTEIITVRAALLLYPSLASINKGELPVVEQEGGKLKLVESYFSVRVQLEDSSSDLHIGERGRVIIRGPWRSLLMEFLRYIQSIYWRESGV